MKNTRVIDFLILLEAPQLKGYNPNYGRFSQPQGDNDDFESPKLTNTETQHLFSYLASSRSPDPDEKDSPEEASRKEAEQDDIYNKLMLSWKQNNFKTDKKTINKATSAVGFTDKEIGQALNKIGAGPSFMDRWFTSNYQAKHDLLDKLSDEVIRNNLGKEVLEIIDKKLNSGFTQFKKLLPGMGKVHEGKNIFNETVLSDTEVRDILLSVLHKKKQSLKTSPEQTQQLNQYIKSWGDKIKKSQTKEEKIMLVKEIVNFLGDRYNTQDWENINGTILSIIKTTQLDPNFKNAAINNIKSGKIMEKAAYLLSTLLILECDLSWSDLNLKPQKINESQIRLDAMILDGKSLLIEDIFSEIIIKNRIRLYENEIKTRK